MKHDISYYQSSLDKDRIYIKQPRTGKCPPENENGGY
jgi:hypothetical protein